MSIQVQKYGRHILIISLALQRGSKSQFWIKDSAYPKVNMQLVIAADGARVPSNFIFTL